MALLSQLRGRVKIALMALLFLLPLITIYWLVIILNWEINAKFYHGQRINPPQKVTITSLVDTQSHLVHQQLEGKWGLLLLDDDQCQSYVCRQRLQILATMAKGLGAKLNTLLLLKKAPADGKHLQRLEQNYPDIKLIREQRGNNVQLFAQLAQLYPQHKTGLYMLDPYQNLMMYYNNNVSNQGIHADTHYFMQEPEPIH